MALPTASDNAFPSLLITEGTEPAAPAAGKQRVYIDSTSHHLKRTDSSGTDVDIETAASGAPADATYVVTSANGSLSNEVVMGAWTSFTPTWTSETSGTPSIGNGTLAGFYLTIGKTHFFRIRMQVGSTTTFGSGRWNFTIGGSVGTATAGQQTVVCHMADSSSGAVQGGGAWIAASASPVVRPTPAGSGSINGISSAVPWTWATSDALEIQGMIEVD